LLNCGRDDNIRALIEKLSSLENVLSHGAAPRISDNDVIAIAPTSADAEVGPRPPKRRFDGELVATKDLLSPPDSVASKGSQSQRPSEGLTFILDELSHNNSLAENQRNVLELAIAFIDQLSHHSSSATEGEVWSNKVPIELTENELLQVLIASELQSCCVPDVALTTLDQYAETGTSQVQLHTLGHIPAKALERMVVGLLENNADARTLTMYKVIVHFKAALNLYVCIPQYNCVTIIKPTWLWSTTRGTESD